MACFLVPTGEAIVSTIVTAVLKSKEKKADTQLSASGIQMESKHKIRFSRKLGWLNKLLWGGSVLLAFEHLWHGEISPAFPFLTAVQTGETADMWAEMGSAGVLMAVLITAVWGGMLLVSHIMEKRADRIPEKIQEKVQEGAGA